MAEIIIIEKETIRQLFVEELGTAMRSVLTEFGLSPPSTNTKMSKGGWLGIEEAKKIVPIKSKKKWKQLRDEAQIDFAKVGKGFIYEISSLHNYILNHSTITKTKSDEKRRK
jgi:hypothetical protein